MARKGLLFCMRYPDDQGFVWRTIVRVRDKIAGILDEYESHVAFPELTGQSAHTIAHMQPVALDCYNLTEANRAKLRAFVEEKQIAAIVYMSALPTLLDMRFLRSLGVKTINTENDGFDHSRRDPLHIELAKIITRRVFRRQLHDLHIPNSHSQGEWLKRYAKIPAKRITVVPNGVDCEHFVPAGQARDTAEMQIICAGQARPEKRVDMIIRMAAKICAQKPFDHVSFTYVGDGEMLNEWRQLAHSLGIAQRFHFAGQHSDLKPFYQAADVMVHAAARESFGLVLAEAMACKLPVIACAAAGPCEIVEDGRTGMLVGIDDEEALRAAMERYLSDPHIARKHGEAGRARASALFSIDRQAREMAAAIRTLL